MPVYRVAYGDEDIMNIGDSTVTQEILPNGVIAYSSSGTRLVGENPQWAEDDEVVHLSGSETITGDKTFTGSVVVPAPVNNTDAATKKYVDDSVPVVPTKTSDLTNDSGYITSSSLPTKTSDLTNDSGFVTSATSPVTSVNTRTGAVALTADDVGAVSLTQANTISGVKTFTSGVTVNTPTASGHAANKGYVDGKFPVAYNQISSSAITQLFTDLKVYHFDNLQSDDPTHPKYNPDVDNTGLVVPYTGTTEVKEKAWLAGFYIPAWTCLIITGFRKGAGYNCGSYIRGPQDFPNPDYNTGWKLPSYVPTISPDYYPNATDTSGLEDYHGYVQINSAIMDFFPDGTVDGNGLGINAGGYIGVNTSHIDNIQCLSGSVVIFLDKYGAVDTSDYGKGHF